MTNGVQIPQKKINNFLFTNVVPLNNIVLTSGTATFEKNLKEYITTQSLKVNIGNFNTSGTSFNFGNTFLTTIKKDGVYYFSFSIKTIEDITIIPVITINGIGQQMFCYVNPNDNFQTFIQSFELFEDDVFNFYFDISAMSLGPTTASILLDGFCLSDGFNESYIYPNNETGYERKLDTLNTITLTGAVENTMSLTGTSATNGGLTLLDNVSKIVPLELNDVITVDFACTFVTPTGTNNYVEIKLLVDGAIYRAFTHQFLKTAGVNDYFSVSWTLSVQEAFLLNGATISLKPNVATDYKDRYIQVARKHRGK